MDYLCPFREKFETKFGVIFHFLSAVMCKSAPQPQKSQGNANIAGQNVNNVGAEYNISFLQAH